MLENDTTERKTENIDSAISGPTRTRSASRPAGSPRVVSRPAGPPKVSATPKVPADTAESSGSEQSEVGLTSKNKPEASSSEDSNKQRGRKTSSNKTSKTQSASKTSKKNSGEKSGTKSKKTSTTSGKSAKTPSSSAENSTASRSQKSGKETVQDQEKSTAKSGKAGVEAALNAAEKTRSNSNTRKVENNKISAESKEAALDSLAAAIAKDSRGELTKAESKKELSQAKRGELEPGRNKSKEASPSTNLTKENFDVVSSNRSEAKSTVNSAAALAQTASEPTQSKTTGNLTREENKSENQPRITRQRKRGGRRRSGSTESENSSAQTQETKPDSNPNTDSGEDLDTNSKVVGKTKSNTVQADSTNEPVESQNDDGEQQEHSKPHPKPHPPVTSVKSGEADSTTSNRRRRRRRRRGEETGPTDDDPANVVVRVREPRRSSQVENAVQEITGIEGSTRMEAKRQRRREGRAAGRKRSPILSEAEFLSRRESVDRNLIIRQEENNIQLAVIEDNTLVEFYVDRPSATSLIGNIYLGRVQNVLPSMEACFIDIGRGRNAVLYAGEVDWDYFGEAGKNRKVEEVFKSGQSVVVQVSKDPVGAKGARLTGHISLPGRFVVYSPNGQLSGISRKLPDHERTRLRAILTEALPKNASVIVRTAAEGASEEDLRRDVSRLESQWQEIEKDASKGSAPKQLYSEPDLTMRLVRDLFTEDFSGMWVQSIQGEDDIYHRIEGYVTKVSDSLMDRIHHWDNSNKDIFDHYRVDEQIAKALERKVFLPSGGSLVIDRTEAMTVIDVNTGKFTGSAGNLEATVAANNLEAAEEIVRQIRLRDIGGIVVIDFIDMVLPANRELLLRRLVECLSRDRTRHQVAEVTSLGLVQMTRKKLGTGLAEAFTESCQHCGGRGFIRFDHPVDSQAPADGGDRLHHENKNHKHSGTSSRKSTSGLENQNDGRHSGSGDSQTNIGETSAESEEVGKDFEEGSNSSQTSKQMAKKTYRKPTVRRTNTRPRITGAKVNAKRRPASDSKQTVRRKSNRSAKTQSADNNEKG